MSLKKLFKPKSLAIIEASAEPDELGHLILKNIIDGGYKGEIYPVNPESEEILGLTCCPSIEELPENVEMAVVVTAAQDVPSTMKQCAKKGIENAVVMSGGFSEVGDEGKDLERELEEIIEEFNLHVLGPNCRGINNTVQNICASWPLITKKGPISIISESGSIGSTLESRASRDNIGISKFASLGNRIDIDESDLLRYFCKDRKTKVIALYIEGLKKGRKFLEAAEKAVKKNNVVMLKGGQSKRGSAAVTSHTNSSGGRYEVFKSVCKRAGILRVDDLDELYDVCKGIANLPKPKEKKTVIITNSGGAGILTVDAGEKLGLDLIDLPKKSVKRLNEKLPPGCVLKNPLDLTSNASAEIYDTAIKVLARYKDVRCIVIIVRDSLLGIADVLKKRFERATIVPVMLEDGNVESEEKRKLQKAKIPVFSSPKRAMKVLSLLPIAQ
ncbi:hypothetical protein AKJ58_00540 [candidate division MSBL1 archaeon SCGC-AAA385D11]|uniref:acetate--CoA ligase (ADP-forming) n=1 Tax=candidate division MSBL1 archaeon SCGC-AAA385D11 TaxID=1698286 RepID=A0A133VP89_9EURY|nr:hypothetical protein AKJ58_00540 [candidate division MSBL1 archaeon SCGC-AAA385D11]